MSQAVLAEQEFPNDRHFAMAMVPDEAWFLQLDKVEWFIGMNGVFGESIAEYDTDIERLLSRDGRISVPESESWSPSWSYETCVEAASLVCCGDDM